MKKIAAALLLLCVLIAPAGCSRKEPTVTETIEAYQTYDKMSDGTWKCNGVSYKYRLELTGRLGNADKDSTFVYLSNLRKISFEQAAKASGLSSNSADYFSPEDAILVELK